MNGPYVNEYINNMYFYFVDKSARKLIPIYVIQDEFSKETELEKDIPLVYLSVRVFKESNYSL